MHQPAMTTGRGLAVAATSLAIVLPTLVVHWVAVGYAVFAQLLSLFGWGLAMTAWHLVDGQGRTPVRAVAPLSLALGVLAAGIAATAWRVPHAAPGPILGALLVVAAAWLAISCAARLGAGGARAAATCALVIGLLVAAFAAAAIAFVQIGAPGAIDGFWIARTTSPGRAGANLLQPNHLATLCVWGLVAGMLAREAGWIGPRAWLVIALVMPAVVATSASRAGIAELAVVALWALADRALRPEVRWAVVLAPLLAVAAWAGLETALAPIVDNVQSARPMARGSLRGEIFTGAWALIRDNPWFGVGWDELGTAWALSDAVVPIGRPIDHLHNLPLQLAAELGLPAALAVVGAALAGLGLAWRRSRRGPRRLLVLLCVVVGVHSLVEMPLWFAYFLLPTAWAFGLALAPDATHEAHESHEAHEALRAAPRPALAAARAPAAAALAVAAFIAFADFARALPAALPPDHPMPLQERLERAGTSRLFSPIAAHLAALRLADAPLKVFEGARHVAIDDELLGAWSRALAREGRTDEARHLARRARLYVAALQAQRSDPCHDPERPGDGLVCGAPAGPVDWRALR